MQWPILSMLSELRELVELHPDSDAARGIVDAIRRRASDYEDGAEDAGPIGHACTRIHEAAAALLREIS